MRSRSTLRSAALAALLVLAPAPLAAQGGGGAPRWFADFPQWSVDVHLGVANHGRFLLQAIELPVLDRQRELRATNGFSWGAAVGVSVLPLSILRLSFTHTSVDLDFEDDTGTGSDLLDDDDVAGLSSSVLGLEARRFLFGSGARVTPYGGLGIALVWWNLDERGVVPLIVSGGDDTEFRFGVSATFGLRYRPAPRWAVGLEVTDLSIRNPFTGNTSFIPVSGLTVDEPTRVRQTHFRVVGSYSFHD